MKIEEKLMTIQTLGKLMEAQYPFTPTELGTGKPIAPTMPKPILDTADRNVVAAKIVELVKSIRPGDNSKYEETLIAALPEIGGTDEPVQSK